MPTSHPEPATPPPTPQRDSSRLLALRGRLGSSSPGDLLLGLLVLGVVVLRFRILRAGGAPPTIDAGNWLAFGDGLLGGGARSTTIVYPPVVPLLSTVSVETIGLVNGVSALAAVSSAAPAVGLYWTLRRCALGLGALIPGLLVLGATAVGEAAAWGGFPQLIALGLTPVALWFFDRLARTWTPSDALRAGIALTLILATSHLVASVVIVASGLILLTGVVGSARERPSPGRTVSLLALTALPSVWLIPLYVSLSTQIIGNATEFRYLTQLEWGDLVGRIEFLFRDMTWLWWPVFALVLATPVLLIRRRQLTLWRLSTATLISTIALTAVTREGRYLYVFTVIAGLDVGLWLTYLSDRYELGLTSRLPNVRDMRVAVGLAVTAAILLAQIAGGLSFFRDQRNFYGVLSPDLVTAIEHVADTTTSDSTIATTSLHDAPLGWWVEAIAQRPTIYAAPLRWLAFDDEIDRATLANHLFAPPFPNPEALTDAATAGVEVILLPTEWVFYSESAVLEFERGYPDAVDRFNSGVTLLYPAAAQP